MKRQFYLLIVMCVVLTAFSFSVFGQEDNNIFQTTEPIATDDNMSQTMEPIATIEPEPVKQIYIDAATDEIYESEEAFFETHNRGGYVLITDLTYSDHQTTYIVPASGENGRNLRNKVYMQMGYPQWVIE